MSETHGADPDARRRSGARRLAIIASAMVLLVVAVAGYLATRPGQQPHAGATPEHAGASRVSGAPSPNGTSQAPQTTGRCPLTGLDPTDNSVLSRPAMAVK